MAYKLTLKNKKEIAEKTLALTFEKPSGFSFTAGQSMRLWFPDEKGLHDDGESRTFSIASAPHERYLLFAMRIRESTFKKKLTVLSAGDFVEADGPFGERFVLHGDSGVPAVFIAGGIGITPLLSMLSYVTHKKLPHTITLFYSNRRKEDIAFVPELRKIEEENKNFKLILTLTKYFSRDGSWYGKLGYVNKEMIKKYVPDITKPLFYISGPPVMVVGIKSTLEKGGVSPEHINTKKFSGY